ncbi:MAG: hypothetical protein ACT443_08235 [Gemmatimonadota bacterium]
MNGKTTAENGARFRRADFGDPDELANASAEAKYASVAAAILAAHPHVIAIAGSIETEKIIVAVERECSAALYRPRWIGTEGVGIVAARIASPDKTFPGRFLTTNVRVDFDGRTMAAEPSRLGRNSCEGDARSFRSRLRLLVDLVDARPLPTYVVRSSSCGTRPWHSRHRRL